MKSFFTPSLLNPRFMILSICSSPAPPQKYSWVQITGSPSLWVRESKPVSMKAIWHDSTYEELVKDSQMLNQKDLFQSFKWCRFSM